jgi:formylmethanofuran dehydrogenase subunit B
MAVYVNGKEVDEAAALARAAEILGQASLPVIAGLATDIAGAQAAIALAERTGGVIDHIAGEAMSRASRLMREAGSTVMSLGEVRNRSDLVVVLGEGPLKANPDLINTIFPDKEGLPRPGDHPREVVFLGCKAVPVAKPAKASEIALGNHDLPVAISMLAAAIREKPFGDASAGLGKEVAELGKRLREAASAIFIYSPLDLDEPVLHVVLDATRTLCDKTRAGTYTVPAIGNGDGVNLCSVWSCGLPVRTSFAHGAPVHDAWRFSAERLIESGEADALIWVDAMGEGGQPPRGVPTVLLAKAGDPKSADVVIEVGEPGEDHDAAMYLPGISGIGMVSASSAAKGDGKPPAAEILARITDKIEAREAR